MTAKPPLPEPPKRRTTFLSVMSQQKMRRQQTQKQGKRMLQNQKLHSDQELQRVQDMFLNDFFNEKSSKKKHMCFISEEKLKQVR